MSLKSCNKSQETTKQGRARSMWIRNPYNLLISTLINDRNGWVMFEKAPFASDQFLEMNNESMNDYDQLLGKWSNSDQSTSHDRILSFQVPASWRMCSAAWSNDITGRGCRCIQHFAI